ncbi:MAG: hypothetical protein WCD53_04210 [Microcoleus sp.]
MCVYKFESDRVLVVSGAIADTELATGIALLAAIVSLILGAIFASFEDDLIKQRDFAWNQEALKGFKVMGEDYWTFNGGGSEGCHRLYIRYE